MQSKIFPISVKNIYVVEFQELVMCNSNYELSYILRCTTSNFNCNESLMFFRSLYDMYSSFEQTLSEGITTNHLSYEEYPEILNGASPDDHNEK